MRQRVPELCQKLVGSQVPVLGLVGHFGNQLKIALANFSLCFIEEICNYPYYAFH
jgi:hypothetical protein